MHSEKALTFDFFRKPRLHLLLLLTLVFAFNRMDYTVISIVLPSIKEEFAVSDSALGLLTGLGFTFFYALMGVPFARWADYRNRNHLVSISTIIFSIMAVASGMAMNFVQLFAARIGVAIGEAGTLPAAQSLIAENFARRERARANAVFYLGSSLGLGGGFLLGGWLNELVGWRSTLMLIGGPGVFVGVLYFLTCKESATRLSTYASRQSGSIWGDLKFSFSSDSFAQSASGGWGHLWRIKSYRFFILGSALAAIGSGAIMVWVPSFFIRSHGMDASAIGVWMASIFGGAGCIGVLLGGELATRFAAGNERLQFRALGLLYILYFLSSCAVFLVPNSQIALACLFLSVLVQSTGAAPLSAILQSIVPADKRALAMAMLLLLVNLVMGLGPLLAGTISDALNTLFDRDSLRYSVLCITPTFALVAWFFWRAGNTVTLDIQAADRNHIPNYSLYKKSELPPVKQSS